MIPYNKCKKILVVTVRVLGVDPTYMGVSKNNGTPKSSIKNIGFSDMIFTIHFGG